MDPGTLAFIEHALALKDVPRKGWLRTGVARPESVADHTWGVSLLGLVVGLERGVDLVRVLELSIVHDVAEAVVGDLVPGEYASREEKLAREREGLAEMLRDAPEALRARLVQAFDELAEGKTPEARLVHQLDKFEMGLQAARYEAMGIPSGKLAEFRASAGHALKDDDLRDALHRARGHA